MIASLPVAEPARLTHTIWLAGRVRSQIIVETKSPIPSGNAPVSTRSIHGEVWMERSYRSPSSLLASSTRIALKACNITKGLSTRGLGNRSSYLRTCAVGGILGLTNERELNRSQRTFAEISSFSGAVEISSGFINPSTTICKKKQPAELPQPVASIILLND